MTERQTKGRGGQLFVRLQARFRRGRERTDNADILNPSVEKGLAEKGGRPMTTFADFKALFYTADKHPAGEILGRCRVIKNILERLKEIYLAIAKIW